MSWLSQVTPLSGRPHACGRAPKASSHSVKLGYLKCKYMPAHGKGDSMSWIKFCY